MEDSRLNEVDEDTTSDRAEDKVDERSSIDESSKENLTTDTSTPIALVSEGKHNDKSLESETPRRIKFGKNKTNPDLETPSLSKINFI